MYVNESIESTHCERVRFQGSNSVALFTFKKYFSSCSRFGAHIVSTVILTNYEHTHKATTYVCIAYDWLLVTDECSVCIAYDWLLVTDEYNVCIAYDWLLVTDEYSVCIAYDWLLVTDE